MKIKSLKEDYEKSMALHEAECKERLLGICIDIYSQCIDSIENKIPLPYCVDLPLLSGGDMEFIVNVLRNDYLIESRFIYWNLYVEEFL